MIELRQSDLPAFSLTARMVIEKALKRGWRISVPRLGSMLMLITRDDGVSFNIFSSTPPTTSFVSSHIAQDKFAAHQILSDAGFRAPETFAVNNVEDGMNVGKALIAAGKSVVTKPLDKAHGTGITVDVDTIEGLESALNLALSFSTMALIQEYIGEAKDIRITAIDGKVVGALLRRPAVVMGDGVHTIAEIITQENVSERRGRNYSKALNVISVGGAKRFLGERIGSIPALNETVIVVGTANLGTGGETEDITDILPACLIKDTERCAQILEMPVVAVDYLVKGGLGADLSQEDVDAYLIEVNKCPALFMHELPTKGKPRPVIDAYMEYLASL